MKSAYLKKVSLAAICFLLKITAYAQTEYDTGKLSPELTRNASVVLRDQEEIFDIRDPGNAVYSCHKVLTILNKGGESASEMHEFYDSFSTVSNLKATLYDGKGTKIKDYRSSDFKDRSAVSDGSMYEDSRVKFLNFIYASFPYTIEYSYTVNYNGIRSYPGWYPVAGWGCAIEKSSYTFRIPRQMSFKYLTSEGLKTDSVAIKDKTEYKWSCTNVPALEYEHMSTGFKNIVPWVSMAPNEFEFDHVKANIGNWKSLGSWMYGLSKGLQELSPEAKRKVGELISGVTSPKEKIKILYQHLQSSTRYVSVQLGVGGYIPIAAGKVCAVNYGDCKGLSNYMKAMLQEAGINSHLVVIGNDMPSLNPKFASMNQANHMILCVPLEKDTTWLECTSPYTPAGFIGYGNAGRTVLLITEDGGKLAETPVYSPADNAQKRVTRVDLNGDGTANILIETDYSCAQFEDNLRMMLLEPSEQRKRMMNSLAIPNMTISNLAYTQPDRQKPQLNEKINLSCSGLLSTGGDKLFLTLNLLNRQESAAAPVENRKTGFSVDYGYEDDDEIIYKLPKGYKVEFVPKDILLESEFGKVAVSVAVKDNNIVYRRSKTIYNKKYPAEKYGDYVIFSKKMYQADKQKAILTKE